MTPVNLILLFCIGLIVWVVMLVLMYRIINGWAKIALRYGLNPIPRSADGSRAFFAGITGADNETQKEMRRLRFLGIACPLTVFLIAAIIMGGLSFPLVIVGLIILLLRLVVKPLDLAGRQT